jgi:hypothetical protein
MFTSDQVAWVSGERARYESSSGVFRAFCPDCGTPLTWEGDDAGTELVQFHIGTLDNPDAFPPRDHTHCGEQISWFETADRLPRYQGSLE